MLDPQSEEWMEWMHAVGGETGEWMCAVPPEGMGLNLLAKGKQVPGSYQALGNGYKCPGRRHSCMELDLLGWADLLRPFPLPPFHGRKLELEEEYWPCC